MKKIISETTVILSVILFTISICSIASISCLKGIVSIQNIIANNKDIFHEIQNKSLLPNKTMLFYIGLIIIILSSVICFRKENKVKSIINVILSIVPCVFVLISHNYILFLIFINLYLFVNLLLRFTIKDKVSILESVLGIIIGILNLIQLIQHLHLQLIFELLDIQSFQIKLVNLSNITLKLFMLWVIPYAILLIKDIATINKSSDVVE